MLRDDEKDVAENEKPPEPCAVCGKFSGCASWGFRLCYGERDGSRMGCVTRLSVAFNEQPDDADLKAFTKTWVAQERAKARAA